MEEKYVKSVYSEIAEHFSSTRSGDKWQYVVDFLSSFTPNVTIADIGCGNGKYTDHRNDIQYIAIDNCKELLDCARKLGEISTLTHVSYQEGDIRNIPCESGSVDGVISIAVFHHLYEKESRFRAIEELIRILKDGGRGMLTVWSTNQDARRFRKWEHMSESSDPHDYYVPWAHRNQKDRVSYIQRYYHIFDKEEILSYFTPYVESNQIIIQECNEIHCNWVIVFQKIKR